MFIRNKKNIKTGWQNITFCMVDKSTQKNKKKWQSDKNIHFSPYLNLVSDYQISLNNNERRKGRKT